MAGKTTNLQLQKIDDTDYAGNFPTIYNNNLDLIDGLKEDINNAKGNVWEEVDLNNPPNDWKDGDVVKIQFKVIQCLSKRPNSWNANIGDNFTTHITPIGGTIVECTLHANNSYVRTYVLDVITRIDIGMYGADITHILCRTIAGSLNSGFYDVFTIQSFAFNGYDSKSYSHVLNKNEITNYIYKMWRLR